MRIQSKATGEVFDIPKEQWDGMNYRKHKYDIIDASDSPVQTVDVEEIMIQSKPIKTVPVKALPTEDEMKAFLKKKKVKFHYKLGLKKLTILYNETKN